MLEKELPSRYSPKTQPIRDLSPTKKETVKVARTLTDIMQVIAIRSAVYMSEQTCPYEKIRR